eukprot:scaffold48_cov161-Amphora_coffeaeformis.AAC.23
MATQHGLDDKRKRKKRAGMVWYRVSQPAVPGYHVRPNPIHPTPNGHERTVERSRFDFSRLQSFPMETRAMKIDAVNKKGKLPAGQLKPFNYSFPDHSFNNNPTGPIVLVHGQVGDPERDATRANFCSQLTSFTITQS